MKLLYTFLGLVVVGLVFGSFYYTNVKKDTADFKASTSTPLTESIYIYREYGDVSFKNKVANNYTRVLDEKMAISNYATVKTGDGRGYVIFPDNSSITLSTSTEIQITYEPTKVSIMQLLGSTYHRVTALASGSKYEVRTPNTLAAIRGTKLAVTYNPSTKKTFVAVTEHSVEVTKTKEDGTASNAPVIVQEGSLADVQSATSTPKNTSSSPEKSGSVTIRNNDEVKEIKLFIDENKVIDKEFDKTPLPERRKFLEKIIDSLQKDTKDAVPVETGAKIETRAEALTRIISGGKTSSSHTDTPRDTPVAPQKNTPTTLVPTKTPVREVTPQVTSPTTSLRELPISAEELTPDDEAFVDNFYAVYEHYFLVDDPTTYCKKIGTMTSRDMLNALLTNTNKAGFILPKQQELTAFASDLVASCADGSVRNKAATFKTRFDITYPY